MATTELILVRHGESVGNLAREQAEQGAVNRIEVAQRDADVLLSDLGCEQARAFGGWLAALDESERPQQIWSSPYVRAEQTARLALDTAELKLSISVDDRLRDRELGVLDMLTTRGVQQLFPDEAERGRWLGKLYYRPPGGESWADVALRIRSFMAELDRADSADRVLVVCHDAVILLWRYVCEQLTEKQLFEIARSGSIINASVTRLRRDAGSAHWKTDLFNEDSHLSSCGSVPPDHPGEG